MSIHNNGEEIIKGTRNKKTGMWEVTLGPQQSENVVNNILAQTSKPELANYLHAALFSSTTVSLLEASEQGFLKTWPGLTDKLIKKHLDKSSNITMVHLHMIRQGLKSTKEKPPDTDLEDKKKNQNEYSISHNCGTYHNQRRFPHRFKQEEQIHICNVYV